MIGSGVGSNRLYMFILLTFKQHTSNTLYQKPKGDGNVLLRCHVIRRGLGGNPRDTSSASVFHHEATCHEEIT